MIGRKWTFTAILCLLLAALCATTASAASPGAALEELAALPMPHQEAFTGTAGARGASPYLGAMHTTMAIVLNGKTNYNPSSDGRPQMRYLYLQPTDFAAGETGTITLNSSGTASYRFADESQTRTFNGARTFNVWYSSNGYHFIADNANSDTMFIGNSEQSLSRQPFQIDVGNTSVAGILSRIRTTTQQMSDACTPYLELTRSGSNLTGVRIRFVNPSATSTTLRMSDQNDVALVSSLYFYDANQNLMHMQDVDFIPNNGDLLDTAVSLSRTIDLNDLYYISVVYAFSDAASTNSVTLYAWDNVVLWDNGSGINPPDDSSSGGGCNTGAFSLAFLASATIAILRKRSR